MRKRRIRILLLILLVLLQVLANRNADRLQVHVDFLFLIILYYCVRSDYYRSIIIASLIGIITDIYSMGILGVFGFSRALIAFFAFHTLRFLDLKRKLFFFFLVFFSLGLSNLIANGFFCLINNAGFNLRMVLLSPVLTAIAGVLILSFKTVRESLDVY